MSKNDKSLHQHLGSEDESTIIGIRKREEMGFKTRTKYVDCVEQRWDAIEDCLDPQAELWDRRRLA